MRSRVSKKRARASRKTRGRASRKARGRPSKYRGTRRQYGGDDVLNEAAAAAQALYAETLANAKAARDAMNLMPEGAMRNAEEVRIKGLLPNIRALQAARDAAKATAEAATAREARRAAMTPDQRTIAMKQNAAAAAKALKNAAHLKNLAARQEAADEQRALREAAYQERKAARQAAI